MIWFFVSAVIIGLMFVDDSGESPVQLAYSHDDDMPDDEYDFD